MEERGKGGGEPKFFFFFLDLGFFDFWLISGASTLDVG